MSAPTAVITATLQDITGQPTAGSVRFTLVNYGRNIPRISGTSILAPIETTVAANAGTGALTVNLWAEEQLTPRGTYYDVTFISSTGDPIKTLPYGFTGAGGDLSTMSPLVTIPATPVSQIPFSQISGNISVSQMNAGTNASSSTFWRGDGTWVAIAAPTSFTPIAHQFLTGMNGSGVFSAAQPAAADLSDGTTGSGAVVLGTSPTLTTPHFSSIINTGTLTLPTSTDTLLGRATTDVLTNKTFDTAGVGNVLKINGTQITAFTGSTQTVVLATSPTIFGGILYGGSTSGTTTLQASAVASGVLTLPATTDTLVGQSTTDTLSNKTIPSSGLVFLGSTSGSTLLVASATANGTAILPAVSGSFQLTSRTSTDTFTNKTLNTAGTGNHIQIGGVDIPTAIGSAGTCLATEDGSTLSFGTKWTFLGKASLGANAATVGPVTWTGSYKHLHIRLRVLGYASSGIASLQLGGAAIDTGANYSAGIMENATSTTTSVSVTGIRVGSTAITSQRFVEIDITNISNSQPKYAIIQGASNSTSAGTAPTVTTVAGLWADTTNAINRVQFTAFNAVTGTTTVNMLTGTEFEVFGRNE
jgi:hypothetical protein